jgi:hypothetical protein
MTRQHDARDTRISNWTLATGTSPGQRGVQAAVALDTLRRPAQEATS